MATAAYGMLGAHYNPNYYIYTFQVPYVFLCGIALWPTLQNSSSKVTLVSAWIFFALNTTMTMSIIYKTLSVTSHPFNLSC
jgi:hypothetical protein